MKTVFTVVSVLILLALSSILLPSCSMEVEKAVVTEQLHTNAFGWEVESTSTGMRTRISPSIDVLGAQVGDTLIFEVKGAPASGYKPAKK